MIVLRWVSLVVIFVSNSMSAQVARLDPSFSLDRVPNGVVRAQLELPDGSIVIGGDFTQVGEVSQAYLAKYTAEGELDLNFTPNLNAPVLALECSAEAPEQKFYVGGSFTQVNGENIGGFVCLQAASGAIESSFDVGAGFNGSVHCIKSNEVNTADYLVVGGEFTQYKGAAAENLVSLNPNAGLIKNFEANGKVRKIKKWDGNSRFICVGDFTRVGFSNVPRVALIQIQGFNTAQLSFSNHAPIAAVSDVSIFEISIPGEGVRPVVTFTGGFGSSGVASFFLQEYYQPLTPISFSEASIQGAISLFSESGDRLIVATNSGSLWSFDEVERVGDSFRWKTEQAFLPSSHANSAIHSICQKADGRFFISGAFTEVDGESAPYFTRLYGPQGISVADPPTIIDLKTTDIRAYVESSEYAYSTGEEYQLSADGGLSWRNWMQGSEPTRFVHGLRPDHEYLIRGRVKNTNGWSLYGTPFSFTTSVARDAGSRVPIPSPLPWPNGGASSISVDSEGHMVVVGIGRYHQNLTGRMIVIDDSFELQHSYNETNNPSINRVTPVSTGGYYVEHSSGIIEKLTSAGVVDPGFTPAYQFPSTIRAFEAQADGKLLIGGDFRESDGASNNALVRLNATGQVDESYAPVFLDGTVAGEVEFILVLSGGGTLVIGDFDSVNGIPAGGVVKLTSSGDVDTSFSLLPSTTQFWFINEAVEDSHGRVILAGLFHNSPNSGPRVGVLRLLADGSIDETWQDPVLDSGFSAGLITIQSDDKVVVAGGFRDVNGIPARGIVRFDENGAVDTTFDVGLGGLGESGLTGSIRDLAFLPNGNLAVAGYFNEFDGLPAGGFVVLRANGALSHFEQFLLMHGLPLDSSPSLDTDGDGIELGLEFAYHLDPNSHDSVKFVGVNGDHADIAFPMERVPQMKGYFSEDLDAWQEVPIGADWRILRPSDSTGGSGFFQMSLDY